MEQILVLIHTEADGSLARSALEAVALAKELGGFTVGLTGESVQGAANQLAASGAARILCVKMGPSMPTWALATGLPLAIYDAPFSIHEWILIQEQRRAGKPIVLNGNSKYTKDVKALGAKLAGLGAAKAVGRPSASRIVGQLVGKIVRKPGDQG